MQMSEIKLCFYEHGRHVCTPAEAVSELDLVREAVCTLYVVYEMRQDAAD